MKKQYQYILLAALITTVISACTGNHNNLQNDSVTNTSAKIGSAYASDSSKTKSDSTHKDSSKSQDSTHK